MNNVKVKTYYRLGVWEVSKSLVGSLWKVVLWERLCYKTLLGHPTVCSPWPIVSSFPNTRFTTATLYPHHKPTHCLLPDLRLGLPKLWAMETCCHHEVSCHWLILMTNIMKNIISSYYIILKNYWESKFCMFLSKMHDVYMK